MYKTIIKAISMLFIFNSLPLLADIDIQKGMYDSAQEMMEMDKKMNRAILEHEKSNPNWDESTEFKVISVHDFEEKENSYLLEREIKDDNQTKVDVKLENGKLTILTTTTIVEKTEFSESETTDSSSTSLFIPNDADETKMEKSYKNGLLTIRFPKK